MLKVKKTPKGPLKIKSLRKAAETESAESSAVCSLESGAYTGAVLSGVALGPILLPLLPSRSFAIKGALIGAIWALIYYLITGASWNPFTIIAAFLALPAVSAFYTLNFTGCRTYTSRSGVKKEMRIGLPIMVCAVVVAILLLTLGRFA